MGDHWPWEARELNTQVPFNETAFLNHRESFWHLETCHWELLCLSPKRPVLYPSRGFNLFRTEVLR
jgi:hypothetical protein